MARDDDTEAFAVRLHIAASKVSQRKDDKRVEQGIHQVSNELYDGKVLAFFGCNIKERVLHQVKPVGLLLASGVVGLTGLVELEVEAGKEHDGQRCQREVIVLVDDSFVKRLPGKQRKRAENVKAGDVADVLIEDVEHEHRVAAVALSAVHEHE